MFNDIYICLFPSRISIGPYERVFIMISMRTCLFVRLVNISWQTIRNRFRFAQFVFLFSFRIDRSSRFFTTIHEFRLVSIMAFNSPPLFHILVLMISRFNSQLFCIMCFLISPSDGDGWDIFILCE